MGTKKLGGDWEYIFFNCSSKVWLEVAITKSMIIHKTFLVLLDFIESSEAIFSIQNGKLFQW